MAVEVESATVQMAVAMKLKREVVVRKGMAEEMGPTCVPAEPSW